MNADLIQRPFHVLGIAPESAAEVARARTQDLKDGNPDQDELARIVTALDQLRSKPEDRLLHELFEIPGPVYLRDRADWDRFRRSHRRIPALSPIGQVPEIEPALADLNLPGLLALALSGYLTGPPPGIDAALDEAPVDPVAESIPLGLHDALFT